jgi:hypothetical protein
MAEVLTVAEITLRFADEWVLVESPQTDELARVKAGKILYHSKDRDEVYRKAVELKPSYFAMLYTGEMPKDTAIVL